MRKISENVR